MQQIKPLSLRRNFSWTFIGNAVYAGCQWGMIVLIAKFGSPEMVGQFTLGFAITAPIMMFANLHLRAVQATDAKYQFAFGDYLGLRIITTGLALLIILAITLISGYSWQTSLVVLLVSLAKAFDSISDVLHGFIQQHERMDRIAVSLIVKGPLSLILLGVGIYISGNVLWGLFGLVLSWGLVLAVLDFRNVALLLNGTLGLTVKPYWNFKTQRNLIKLSFPLGFVMMLISLNTNIPRYFIEQNLGVGKLGIFAAIAYLMVVINMIVSALGESASPKLAKYYANSESTSFSKLLLQLVGIAAILAVIGVSVAFIGGQHILKLLYREEYAEQTNIFILLMVAAGIGYISSFLGYGMTAARYFRIQMPLFGLVTTVSAITCAWLIPTNGLEGAAIALILSAIVQAIVSMLVIFHALYKLKKSEFKS